MSDRLSRDELESDALVSGYAKAYAFYQENKNALIYGTLAVLILIAAGVWYYMDRQQKAEEAQELLTGAEELFQQERYEDALLGDDEGMTVGFAEIASDYPRTDAGNIASYYAAVSSARIGNYEDALSYIENYSPPDGILGVGPVSFKAAVLANLDEHERAIETYIQAAEWDDNDVTTPQNLMSAAEVAFESGNDAQARELVDRILNNYGNSEHASDARRMHGLLSARGS